MSVYRMWVVMKRTVWYAGMTTSLRQVTRLGRSSGSCRPRMLLRTLVSGIRVLLVPRRRAYMMMGTPRVHPI